LSYVRVGRKKEEEVLFLPTRAYDFLDNWVRLDGASRCGLLTLGVDPGATGAVSPIQPLPETAFRNCVSGIFPH
jgi:hypothetical protein